MIKNFSKKVVSLLLVGVSIFSMFSGTVSAANNISFTSNLDTIDENSVLFENINDIEVGDCIEKKVVDKDGNLIHVGLQLVEGNSLNTRASSRTWRAYVNGVYVNAEFYMVVSNNQVTRVYNDKITVIGGTYSNKSLTKTSTYGKLTYKISIAGVTTSCWLKGAVTGSNNEIKVTWDI